MDSELCTGSPGAVSSVQDHLVKYTGEVHRVSVQYNLVKCAVHSVLDHMVKCAG